MDEGLDLSRREFMQVGSVSMLSLSAPGQLQVDTGGQPNEEYEFQGVADLMGPAAARPAPDDGFFDNKVYYAYRYTASDTGAISTITQDDVPGGSWSPVNYIQHQPVFSADDLPAPTNGTHTLTDNTAYHFFGFVTSPYGIELGTATPLIGRHGSIDGFIHTGTNTAFVGENAGVFMRDLYGHAPGGTMFDLSGDQSTEMLVESCAFSDAAGIGQIASLGTIDGLRVPTFKGVNFEDFASGFTLTGTPDKIFFEGCPLRGVTAPGVTILQFDANLTVDIVDMPNNYVKSVQSDTEVINVDPGATITEIFQYRGNTHDSSVVESNILTGAAAVDTVGFRVSDSYPLPNTKAFIDYTLDADTTVTIATQAASKTDAGAYERVTGTTTERGLGKFSHADNLATYIGRRDRIAELQAVLSLGTGTNDVVAAAWFQNGTLVPGSATRIQMSQQGGGVAKPLIASGIAQDMEQNDEFDVRVANLGSTSSINVGELTAKITT